MKAHDFKHSWAAFALGIIIMTALLVFTGFPPLIAAGFYVYAIVDVVWHNVIKPRRIARQEANHGA